MSDTRIPVKRAGLWIAPAFFLALSLVVLAGAPEVGTKIFYAVFTLVSGYWLFRSTHVHVHLDDYGLRVHGQARTRRFAWNDIEQASSEPMRTKSPFARRFPYIALVLELKTGKVQQFDDVSAPLSERVVVDAIVDEVNGRFTK